MSRKIKLKTRPVRKASPGALQPIIQQIRTTTPHEAFDLAADLPRRFPDEPEAYLLCALTAGHVGFEGICQVTLREMLRRFPGHPGALKVLEDCPESDLDFEPEHQAEYEWMEWHLSRDRPEQARDRALSWRKRFPQDLVAGNVLTVAYLALGQIERARRTAESVLAVQSDNVYALSNLVNSLVRAGHLDEARQAGERLKACRLEGHYWIKAAEGLSYLGDDQGILELFRRSGEDAGLNHYAAVAIGRQGDWASAVRLWQESDHPLAAENLANARNSDETRHSPWPFGPRNWLHPSHDPDVEVLLPVWLDRGDPATTQLALETAEKFRLLSILQDFASSRRGTAELRARAARSCFRPT